MKRITKVKVVIYPFCDTTPFFLTQDFYRIVGEISKLKKKIVVLCFYIKGKYKNELNVLLKNLDGKILLFGESFLKRIGKLQVGERQLEIVLWFDLFLPKFWSHADLIVGLDDEQIYSDLTYKASKLQQKLIFIAKNGEFLDFYSKNIQKNRKKEGKFYVQIVQKLIK